MTAIGRAYASTTFFKHLFYTLDLSGVFHPLLAGVDLDTGTLDVEWDGMTGQVRGQPLQPLGHRVIDNQRLNKQRGRPQAVSGNLITHPALSPGIGWQALEKAAAGHSHH